MLGYASSADKHLCCDEITIEVFPTDYFSDTNTSSDFEVYSVSRDFARVRKLKGEDDTFSLPYQTFIKIAQLLHSEEIKNSCACRISWHSSDMSYVEKTKTELVENVWLPTPIYVDRCPGACINVTSLFFDDAPKPLSASMVCDVLNLIIAHSHLSLPHSFFNCMNSLYCSVDVLRYIMHIFGDCDFLSLLGLEWPKIIPRTFDVQKEFVAPLKKLDFSSPSHSTDCLHLFVDAKRQYISSVCKDLISCIESKSGWQKFLSSFLHYTEMFSDQLINFADVFIKAENINSISDVWYLTLYELGSAFAFFDTRLGLKTIVRRNRLRQRILNKLNTPPLIVANI